jgi:PAS domain S-box-containing protein
MRDADGALQGFMAVQSDITPSKLDAERLSASKRRLKAVIESMDIGTWEWNVQTGEVVYNERWAQIMGRTLQEISPTTSTTWLKYIHPDDVPASNALMLRHFAGETPFFDTRRRMLHRDGHWVWVHERRQTPADVRYSHGYHRAARRRHGVAGKRNQTAGPVRTLARRHRFE